MAKDIPAVSTDKQIECRVMRPYGGRPAGATITVAEREYNRLREPVLDDNEQPTGLFAYPVLITREHETEVAARERKAMDDAAKTRQDIGDRSTGPGWEAYERRSLEAVRNAHGAEVYRQDEERKRIAAEHEAKKAATA